MNLHVNEFDTEEVKSWIESCAEQVADDDQWCDGVSLMERTYEAVDGVITYTRDALMVIAYYGAFDALKGQDYEDSPIYQFTNDVYERACQICGREE